MAFQTKVSFQGNTDDAIFSKERGCHFVQEVEISQKCNLSSKMFEAFLHLEDIFGDSRDAIDSLEDAHFTKMMQMYNDFHGKFSKRHWISKKAWLSFKTRWDSQRDGKQLFETRVVFEDNERFLK